ncbi:lipoprotein [Caballeronia temeraria]|uniref:Lipoprotein n=1 Tax=Caballeronia temeraria TaxID=1777137 RepID=A0A158CWB2_9BURK|nr:transcriptional regulator [Caballeronia temeraria]SAK85877.1 lipoprotein [Caballeronia temeraria]
MKTLVCVIPLLVSASAFATAPHVNDGILVDEHGMTLYVFGGTGTPDAKSCEGDCARNFPPAIAQPDDKAEGKLSLVSTTDSSERQWAYQGKRLYHGAMDKKPGDTHGDGLNTVWHVVRPK